MWNASFRRGILIKFLRGQIPGGISLDVPDDIRGGEALLRVCRPAQSLVDFAQGHDHSGVVWSEKSSIRIFLEKSIFYLHLWACW